MKLNPFIWIFVAAAFSLTQPAQAQDVADRLPLKYEVVHNHKKGSCNGVLTIEKWTFTYVSADRPEDSRTWKVTDIKEVESKTSDELVLKTRESGAKTLGQDRNYKFKVAGAGIEREVVDYMNSRVR